MTGTTVFTIGHSTHPLDEFVRMLDANGIRRLVDVRTVPGSRHNPQFGEKALAASMPEAGVDYVWMKELGGLRHTPAGAPTVNGAWRNASFRNYADYMQTPEFSAAIGELVVAAREQVVAIMCAEAVPWRCHRSLIADALVARGVAACEIVSAKRLQLHRLTPFAVVDGERVTYPPDASSADHAANDDAPP